MKTYTNSKGESLPKVICAVVEFENKRLIDKTEEPKLSLAFYFLDSIIFGTSRQINREKWE